MKFFLSFILFTSVLILSSCSNPKGELEELGIPYSQDNFFDKGVYKENKRVIELFLEAGLDVKATDKDGDSVLHNAAYKGNIEIIKMVVLEYNGDVKQQNKKGYDVVSAYLSKNISKYEQLTEMVSFLIKQGADLSLFSKIQNNALVRYTDLGGVNQGIKDEKQLKLLKYMFDNGYDVNAKTRYRDGQNYLTAAGYDGDFKLINLLLDYDINVNYRKTNGETVFHNIYKGFPRSVGSCGADCAEKRATLNKKVKNAITSIMKLIEKGGNFTQVNYRNETPLGVMETSSSRMRDNWIKDLVAIALENGEDINATNLNEKPVMYRVLENIRTDNIKNIKPSVKFMLTKGADPLMRKNYDALDAFCLHMGAIHRTEKNTHPQICSPRNVDAFKDFFLTQ